MSIDHRIAALESEAQIAHDEHRYVDAVALHSKALLLAQQLGQPRLLATLFNRLGSALETNGRIQDAVIAYELGLKALAAEQGLEIEAALRSLGTVPKGYDAKSASDVPSLYHAVSARNLSTAQSDPALPVRLLINIGNAYLRQSQESPALNAYKQAIGRPEIASAPDLKAHALTHIALIHRRRGKIDIAETMLLEAIALLDKSGQPTEKRRALAILAGIYRDQGKFDRAQQTYHQALDLYKSVDDPRGESRTLAGLGHLLLEKGAPAEALRIFEQAFHLAQRANDPEMLWHVYWGLGQCRRQAGDLELASQLLRQSLNLVGNRQCDFRTDEGKIAFMESVQDIFDSLIDVHLKMAQSNPAQYETALLVVEEARARALYDLMGSRRRRFLSTARQPHPSRLGLFAERFATAEHPDSATFFNPVSQIAPGGPSDSAIPPIEPEKDSAVVKPPPLSRLVFHVLSDCTAVFAIPPSGAARGHVIPWGKDEVARRVRAIRRALKVDDTPRGLRAIASGNEHAPYQEDDYRALLNELYAHLVAPIADVFPLDGTPVVIEPHRALWLLPFAALLDKEGNWLADHWPLLYTPSAQTLEEIRAEPDYGSPRELKAMIVGDPTMPKLRGHIDIDLRLSQLPGAREEAEAIFALFPAGRSTLLLGAQADRHTVEKAASEHGIIHLATHGLAYAESPLASFIALADSREAEGLLTARQVSSLTLPADLVTLSACQTGLGKVTGEGMIGLSRAFLVAGARTVLVSLWSISDRATTSLVKSFYHWYMNKDDKALALQKAMRELRNRPGYEHPRYWAAFVVIGAEA